MQGETAQATEEPALVNRQPAFPKYDDFDDASRPRVYRYFHTRIHNHEESEDQTQEVFKKLWQKYGSGWERLEAWQQQGLLWRTCHNHWVSWLRKSGRTVSYDEMIERQEDE